MESVDSADFGLTMNPRTNANKTWPGRGCNSVHKIKNILD